MAAFSGCGNGNVIGNQLHPPFLDNRDYGNRDNEAFFPMEESISTSPSSSPSSVPRFIEHCVSKYDTLAGVAIKYGVEVADIKKMNGLVTELQMFALKSIQIPLPGRHPPSPCMFMDETTPRERSFEEPSLRRLHFDFLDSLESSKASHSHKKFPSIQQHHKSLGPRSFLKVLNDEQPLTHHRKSRSFVTSLLEKTNGRSDVENLLRRRQKSEADFTLLAGEECNTKSKCKGLAQRPTAANKNLSMADGSSGHVSVSQGESVKDVFCSVRRSSSTSSLQEQETMSLRSSCKWNLRPDVTATICKPIFDGLPKPVTGRRNKAALD